MPQTILIVGGGASGSLVATGLLQRAREDVRVIVLDPSTELGRGAAYSRSQPCVKLNVRAGAMSAFPEDPGHFSRWLIERNLADETDAAAAFASRCDYGAYLGETLRSAQSESKAEFVHVKEVACHLNVEERLTVVAGGGERFATDRVVLATGNRRPCCPTALKGLDSNPRFLADPWNAAFLSQIGQNDTVFVVGTGLTMVDAYLLLQAQAHSGKVIARSRRGLLPRSHRAGQPIPFHPPEPQVNVLRFLCKTLRDSGEEWRSTLDGIRPHTVNLWHSLSWKEREKFVRRLRPYWEVFRHRMPESAAQAVEEARNVGQLDIGAGRILSCAEREDGFELRLSGIDETIHADWILNCTGANLDIRSEKIPLLESVVSAGLASYDPLGMGLLVDDAGRTDETGRLWAIGPLCRGCRWETTAIPEIRVQAARIAAEIFA